MVEGEKKSGLQKDISSIFAGLEDIDNGRAEKPRVTPKEISPPSGMVPPLPTKGKKNPPDYSSSLSLSRTSSGSLITAGSFPKRRNSFVGLDIGFSSIKLIQLYPVSEGWEIGGYAIQEFKMEGAGKIHVESEHFARRLKELFAKAGIPKGGVICSLRGEQVNTGLIQLARMPKRDLVSASRLEVGRRVTFNIDKALIHNISVEKNPARPGGKLNYIVTAVSRDIVSIILNVLREAGLQVAALLPLPFVWKDCLRILSGVDDNTIVAVVDIGAIRTQICIYKGSRLHFSRDFETGGSHITEAIIQAGQTFGVKIKISWEDAEDVKRTTDFFRPDSGQILKDNLTVIQVAGMVRPVLEKIVKESNRSLDYYRQLYREEEVSRVYLCGGGSLLQGFERFFRERMRPPVEMFRPLDQFKLHSSIDSRDDIEKIFPRLARVTALSLSRRWEVNFIPPLDKILQNVLRRKVLILILVIALFSVSFLFYRSKAAIIPQQKKSVELKRKQLNDLQLELAPYKVLSGLEKRLNAREKVGLYSSLRQPNWKGILKEFSRITPPSIILSEIISLEGEGLQRILCTGRVLERERLLHSGVTQFIVQVENSPFFKDVEKISEDIENGTFSFSCTLIY